MHGSRKRIGEAAQQGMSFKDIKGVFGTASHHFSFVTVA
jgi:hypothetical protein